MGHMHQVENHVVWTGLNVTLFLGTDFAIILAEVILVYLRMVKKQLPF